MGETEAVVSVQWSGWSHHSSGAVGGQWVGGGPRDWRRHPPAEVTWWRIVEAPDKSSSEIMQSAGLPCWGFRLEI